MTRVLQVLTSHNKLGDTDRVTGYWSSELTHAYREFEQAGYQIDLASIKGGTPPLDPLSDPHSEESLNRSDQMSIDFYREPDLLARLATTSRLKELDPAAYDVVYFVGGAGAMWDFPDDPDLIAFVRTMWERGKIVSSVCHGSAALTNVRLADGSYLIAGRRVTGFSNKEEKYLEEQLFHLPKFVPWYLQDRLVEHGGIYDEGAPYTPYVVVDGKLCTGQQPASGGLLARTIVEQLGADQS
jgi:putative intracellular protease/amidase